MIANQNMTLRGEGTLISLLSSHKNTAKILLTHLLRGTDRHERQALRYLINTVKVSFRGGQLLREAIPPPVM